MKKLLLAIFSLISIIGYSQTTGYLRYDTVKIMKQNGNSNLIIENATRDSLGFLYNYGGGRTRFEVIRSVPGGIKIGEDTIIIAQSNEDMLLSGGEVTYSGTGFKFYISPAVYIIGGLPYSTTYDSVTLSASDPDDPRKDVIYLATTGVEVAEGTPAGPAAEPQLDAGQIKLTVIDIPALSTTPGLTQYIIWDENTESVVTNTGTTTDPDDVSNPYHLTKDVNVTNIGNNDFVFFTLPSTVSRNSFDALSFFLKLKQQLPSGISFRITFFNDATQVSTEVPIAYTRTSTNYQGLSMGLERFTFNNYFFNKIRIRFYGAAVVYNGFYLDYIYLEKGLLQPGTGGGDGGVTSVGDIDTKTASPNGAVIEDNRIYFNNASQANPGLFSPADKTKLDSMHSDYFIDNVGDGEILAVQVNDSTVGIKSLKEGTGVTLDVTDTTITINSSGGGGTDNANAGAFYRWLKPATQEIKTWAAGYGFIVDSTTNTDALTSRIDTTLISTRAWRDKLADSLGALISSAGANEIDVFLIGGQSNAQGVGDSSLAPYFVDNTAYQYYSGTLSELTLRQVGNSATGSAWNAFAQTYYAITGRKILFVPSALSGSGQVAAANPGSNWDASGTLYGTSVTNLNNALSAATSAGYTPIFKGILWSQGETDADKINDATITQADYISAFAAMRARYRGDLGINTPFYIFRIGTLISGNDAGYASVRAAQVSAMNGDSLTNVVFWNAVDFNARGLHTTGYHYTQAGYNEMGRMGAQNVIASRFNYPQVNGNDIYIPNGSLAVGGSIPSTKAILDLTSTTKAFLPPRMTTTQMNAISSPAQGSSIFNTTVFAPWFFTGSNWREKMYDQSATNYTLTGTNTFSGTLLATGLLQTAASGGASNLQVIGGSTASASSAAALIVRSASGTAYRMAMLGSTNYTVANASYNYGDFVIGAMNYTERSSGTSPLGFSLIVHPIAVTNAGGSTTDLATLYIPGPITGVTPGSGNPSYTQWNATGLSRFGGGIIIDAGTAAANTAPLKFTSGTHLTTPENGAVEYDGTHLYVTIGGVRYQLDQQSKPTLTKNATVENPTASENMSFFRTPVAITVTDVTAVLVGSSTPSVTYQISFGTDRTSATNVYTAGQTVTSTTTGTAASGVNDATIPAGSFVWITTSAQSGTVGQIFLSLTYTED